jgi:hypothetical protein
VIIVLPGAIPVAKPDEETAAIAGFELAQVTWVVMLEVELLELSPVAENCWVEPTARLTGSPGVIIIEDSVGVGVGEGVDEQAAITSGTAAIRVRTRK